MPVASLHLDLHLPQVRSLKEKRAVLRPLLDGLRQRYQVAVAEVGAHDTWQRAVIGIAVVSAAASHADEVLDRCERFAWSFPEIDIVETRRRWLDEND